MNSLISPSTGPSCRSAPRPCSPTRSTSPTPVGLPSASCRSSRGGGCCGRRPKAPPGDGADPVAAGGPGAPAHHRDRGAAVGEGVGLHGRSDPAHRSPAACGAEHADGAGVPRRAGWEVPGLWPPSTVTRRDDGERLAVADSSPWPNWRPKRASMCASTILPLRRRPRCRRAPQAVARSDFARACTGQLRASPQSFRARSSPGRRR